MAVDRARPKNTAAAEKQQNAAAQRCTAAADLAHRNKTDLDQTQQRHVCRKRLSKASQEPTPASNTSTQPLAASQSHFTCRKRPSSAGQEPTPVSRAVSTSDPLSSSSTSSSVNGSMETKSRVISCPAACTCSRAGVATEECSASEAAAHLASTQSPASSPNSTSQLNAIS